RGKSLENVLRSSTDLKLDLSRLVHFHSLKGRNEWLGSVDTHKTFLMYPLQPKTIPIIYARSHQPGKWQVVGRSHWFLNAIADLEDLLLLYIHYPVRESLFGIPQL